MSDKTLRPWDPESRIMKTKDGYEEAYNCQAGVQASHDSDCRAYE